MIATTRTFRQARAAAPVDDPRRSYDRGIWVGPIAGKGAPSDLATVPIDALRRELERRQTAVDALLARRSKLAAELAALDAELRQSQPAIQPAPRAPGAGQPARRILPRPKNSISLPDALALAVEVRALVSPTEAARLVRANGFQTTSKCFVAAVSNALARDGRFTRVARGRYERIT